MSAIADVSLSGEAIERRFYISIWERYTSQRSVDDLRKRMNEYESRFQSVGITVEIVQDREIAQLINLIHNPAYAQLENIDENSFKATIPLLIQ
jgi:hypothetical protein